MAFCKPTPYVFNFTEKTKWKSISNNSVKIQGRLLGGCIDTIRHLIGTRFGEVQNFKENYIKCFATNDINNRSICRSGIV